MMELVGRLLDIFYETTGIEADGTWRLEEDGLLRKAWHGYGRVVAVETELDPNADWMLYHEHPDTGDQIEILDERVPRDVVFHEAEQYMTETCWAVHSDYETREITQADIDHLGG